MKIINLKKKQTVKIGDTYVTFLRKAGAKGFELGIEAPPLKLIHREEYFVVVKKDRERLLKRSDKNDGE